MLPSTPSIEQLQRRIAELELLNARSAHDLKGPLVTIAGFLKELSASAKAGRWDEFDADVAHITRVLGHMQRMLDGLLQLARLDRSVPLHHPLPVSRLVQAAVDNLAGLLNARGAVIHTTDNLPSVDGDEGQLVGVFQNLLENAVKFTPATIHPQIDIGCRCDGASTVFFVRDHGVGIPMADGERVWEPFVRLNLIPAGAGLGLSIVKQTIERHSGKVWVESPAEGPGTMICFTLPLAEV